MITIGYSTKKINPEFRDYIEKSCGVRGVEVIPFENPGSHSLTEAYNIILEKSSNDIVVLCHDDIYFEKKNWGNKVLKHFKRNPDYGILGVAGSTKLPTSAKWWEEPRRMRGIVNHEHEGKKWTSKYSTNLGNRIEDVVLVDGLFMVLNKNNIKKPFNEEVKGFHMYDVDFCFRNYIEEVKIGVVYDIRITHLSIGQTNEQWEKNREEFAERNIRLLPVRIKKHMDINSPIKVLISSLFFKTFTGSEMYVYELAKELIKLNCDVTVLSDIDGPLSKIANKYKIKTLPHHQPPGYIMGDGVIGFNTPQGFHKTEKGKLYRNGNYDFDIIHAQHKPITERLLQLYPDRPKVSTIHSEVISLEDPVIDNTIVKYITIRPEISDKIINQNGVEPNKVELIYNPLDNNRFNTKNTIDKNYILFVGTIDYLRENTIKDISEYAKSQSKELWIVGENKSNYLSELTKENHVKHFPPTHKIENFVKECSETAGILLGRTTIESWMCGKPSWIYQVDDKGSILSKERTLPPSDINKFYSSEVAKKIKSIYIDSLNEWENLLDEKDKLNNEKMIFNGRKIKSNNVTNWGDLVPYKIINSLFDHDISEEDVFNVRQPNKNYSVYSTGSVMHFTKKDSVVWGTGCIKENAVGEKPKKVYAVRGPLTRQELLKKGIECPEIYGDPALLYPMIYNPTIEKKYKWGIIPHYIEFESDEDLKVLKNLEKQGFKIIDICSGEKEFIDQLLEVENVISSSLHGLIVADTYGIPNARVNISNKLIGGNFKFKDYCLSVSRKIDLGYQLNCETTLDEISQIHFNTSIVFDKDKLIKSNPWNVRNI
jgi:pyruvyltransferase